MHMGTAQNVLCPFYKMMLGSKVLTLNSILEWYEFLKFGEKMKKILVCALLSIILSLSAAGGTSHASQQEGVAAGEASSEEQAVDNGTSEGEEASVKDGTSAENVTASEEKTAGEAASEEVIDHRKEGIAYYCSLAVPSAFEPGDEQGVFVNKSYPIESSIIRFNEYYNGKDIALTNREKKELEESGVKETVSEPEKLTKEIYAETVSAAYNSKYGQDVGLEVSSFENITMDGFPGFKITSSYQAADEERIYQTVYMIISKYRVFTITFQRAEDDDCDALFEECTSTIRIH